ncbi:adhesion domain-containing protein [Citrobacter freundii]|uniref:adhesion domain-containing protein n=1 Tax=Citrobacter freundii TaxID=546 RepID=UPI00383A7A99
MKTINFLLMLVCVCSLSAHAALKGGTWQEVPETTGAINGTAPQADSATIPVYQGSARLKTDEVNMSTYNAMPRDFSADAAPDYLMVNNASDVELDTFAVPPLRWDSTQLPVVQLVWADAATPDTPLSPQPVANKTFCAQNLAGRKLVVWPQLDTATATPPLWLYTSTGLPNETAISVVEQKAEVDIDASVGEPLSVSADHFDDSLGAAKVKAGESITLTVTTRNCAGEVVGNRQFIITRGDAVGRKEGVVNNTAPVHVGDVELTTTATEYHGVSDEHGVATVVITQLNSLGVKTPLKITSVDNPSLSNSVNVIFTTITSPDSAQANMWGHMTESATAGGYTFTRPVLAAEASDSATIMDNNESWALFTWSSADNHCDILPDSQQLAALEEAYSHLESNLGWPLAGGDNGDKYWSSTIGSMMEYHYAVNMRAFAIAMNRDATTLLTSCVDKASPAVTPIITLSLDNYNDELKAAKVKVGGSITMKITVKDQTTGNPLPYRALTIQLGTAQNRQGVANAQWGDNPILLRGENLSGTETQYQTGTDANGEATVLITQDNGAGVLTPINVSLSDGSASADTQVIFTVVTSPDVSIANMWGHMQGVVDRGAGNLYKRPLLAGEARSADGRLKHENNEDWATFKTLAAAETQCGTGQMPGQVSLDSLYHAFPENQIGTDHGWPTQELSYLAADTDGIQNVHVNLANGSDETYTGSQENYLTCSGNEAVTILEVSSDQSTSQKATAKVGEMITLKIHARNLLNNLSVPYTDFTITMARGTNRQMIATGFTDPTDGALTMNGTQYGPSLASMIYQGITDASGNAEVVVEQPQGVGLSTPLTFSATDSIIDRPAYYNVTFTVPTSPDVAAANMWGHMAETITVGDLMFERPKLQKEATAAQNVQIENNESWARVSHADALNNTAAGGCEVNHLPRIDQLSALYAANSSGAIHSVSGWPVLRSYWSGTFTSASTWDQISLNNGDTAAAGSSSDYVSCLASANPTAATITIEPVDASQWYDNAVNNVHAAKVKKGDTLQLLVTVKDASGNPVPSATFVLSRGDGYDRQGTKYVVDGGDQSIVSPLVIDGESLNDIETTIGGQTGAGGQRVINVTRPDTHGTLMALKAALYDNRSVSASIDTLFTVVTSPDTDKAKMWGHMPDTLTAADGMSYHRPLLLSELSSTANTSSHKENNETWAMFYGPDSSKNNPAMCAEGYYPSVSGLDSLYSAYSNQTINSQQGWPIDNSYWSSTWSGSFSAYAPSDHISVDLDDDGRSTSGSGGRLYQICSSTPTLTAAQITLTSPQAQGDVAQVKVKNSETVSLLVTTLDAQGNPVGNTPFVLQRAGGTSRSPGVYSGKSTLSLAVMGQTPLTSDSNTYSNAYGVTGSDGTLAITLSDPQGLGLGYSVGAWLLDNDTQRAALTTIFTTITSPDSEKAVMWGHMPETFTASNGAEFKRPLLYNELSSKTDTSIYAETNEDWYVVKNIDQGRGACPLAQMATMDDLKALYDEHPGGAIVTSLGLPVGKNWWAGDRRLSGQSIAWQYDNLKTGYGGTTTSMNSSVLQLCLTAPLYRKLVFTLQPWDENRSAAVAKKGEKMTGTITVKDQNGQPLSNEPIRITRGNSLTRAENVYTSDNADAITLSDIQLSNLTTVTMDSSGQNLFLYTNAQGQATFTLTQDKTVGLKTPLSVLLLNDETRQDTKDAIFTVITSPDSDKATMWGHMPETVTNSAGVTFHRPYLAAETSDYATGVISSNERWPLWAKSTTLTAGKSDCDEAYQPLLSDLQTLYADNPSGALFERYGWPVNEKWYWFAVDRAANTGNYQSMRLDVGNVLSNSSTSVTGPQVCLVDPHSAVPATIELTSSIATDTISDAVKVKKGEENLLTVTMKDSSGNPSANTAFTISRSRGLSRLGETKTTGNGGVTDDLSLQELTPVATTVLLDDYFDVYHGVTGADGKATFSLRQDTAMGLKTAITAKMDDYPNLTSSLNVIFTVVTSPDSDKARYWGHMPETVTSSDGVVFKRPQLDREAPLHDNTFGPIAMGDEVWTLFNHDGAGLASKSGCPENYQPTLSELQKLHSDYPGGQLGERFGWPIDRSNIAWWVFDRVGENYQTIDLTSGYVNTTKTASDNQALVCLANPRASASMMTLSPPR